MQFVSRGFLDSNYRQPACIADVSACQHAGGGQKGALQIHYVDQDSVSGREIHCAHVEMGVNVKQTVRRIIHQDITTARKSMQKLTDRVREAYVVALTKELIEATACVIARKKSKKESEHPDVLVLAPRCSDDPDFVPQLKRDCLKQNSRIRQLSKNGQLQFGTVGEWTGSDCPLVILTGFHQPYHLLTNVGCIGHDDILTASVVEGERQKAVWDVFGYLELLLEYDAQVKYKNFCDRVAGEWELFEERNSILETRLKKIPVDTLLYIAVTRATWGLSVVEPFAKRFVAHYQIGTKGRSLSRAGEPFTAKWSDDSVGPDEEGPNSRVLRNGQILLDTDDESKSLNMSGKDLELVPQCVIDLVDTKILDLSVNRLKRLPSDLWNLPLRTFDISYNPSLGRVLLSVLEGASQCTSLQELRLRAVVRQGGVRVVGLQRY